MSNIFIIWVPEGKERDWYRKKKKIEEIITEIIPNFERQKFTDLRSSEKTKQDKHKEKWSQIYHNQLAENLKKEKINLEIIHSVQRDNNLNSQSFLLGHEDQKTVELCI